MGVVTALKRFIRAVVPHLIVLSLLTGYLIFGAAVFTVLEAGQSDMEVYNSDMKELRDRYMGTNVASVSPILAIDNGALLVTPADGVDFEGMMDEVLNRSFRPEWKIGRMQAVQSKRAWTFPSSMLFCMTTITTIGYGDVVPVTVWGKVFCVVYSLIGIPLSVLFMGGVGSLLAKVILNLCRIFHLGQPIRKALCSCCSRDKKETFDETREHMALEEKTSQSVKKKKNTPSSSKTGSTDLTVVTSQHDLGSDYQDEMEAPVLLVVAILIGYMCAGAFMMSRIENWSYGEALYFTYITLTTIGFGDYVPMMLYKEDAYFVCVVYCFFGLAVMSMCITLVQAKVVRLGNRFWDCIGF